MTGATLFSGIGAPECSAPWIYWRFAAEIEHFPSAVLKERFPHVPNLGDVTASDFIERARAACAGAALDVLIFGSPCQSYSIAGKRLGLNDPRGNLALHALRVVAALQPRWFVFENVPGLLSSWSGGESSRSVYDAVLLDPEPRTETSDFASFLHAVAECGYSACWASPDAQWFGVAQRRERVFLVGHRRDWRGPAGVLSEFHRVPWDPPSRGESGEAGGVAGTLPARTRGGGGLGTDAELDGGIVPVLSHTLSNGGRMDGESETFIAIELSNQGSGGNVGWSATGPFPTLGTGGPPGIAHTLRGEGMDASEDGTGRGTPIVMHTTGAGWWKDGAGTLRSNSAGPHEQLIAQTVTAEMYRSGGATAGNNGEPRNVIAVNMRGRDGGAMPEPSEVASVRAASGGSSRSLVASTRLRRLTPLETERLQGFPDHWTAIDYRRRRISPAMARYLMSHGLHAEFDARLRGSKTWRTRVANDTVRYRAVGNSMAVPVLDYLLKRIREVDQLMGGK